MADKADGRIKGYGDLDPEVWRLFDRFVHGGLDRRGFLREAARFAVGGLTAAGILEALTPRFAEARQVPEDDKRLNTSRVQLESPKGYQKAGGYLVRPANAPGRLPVVLVIHENRGLNPHIEDVARRTALAGYIAFAPDALLPLGGYPGDEDKAREKFKELDQERTKEDFLAATRYAEGLGGGTGKVGAVGFCWGGMMANFLATRVPALAAAVPFYGTAPEASEVPRIKAALQIHFAEKDERVNATWPPYEAALEAAKVKYEAFTYPGTQHGFHNDTTPRHDAAAAKLAWERTLALFARTLKS